MKRPVAMIGFTYLLALLAANFLPDTLIIIALFLALLTGLKAAVNLRRHASTLVVSVSVFAALASFFVVTAVQYAPVVKLAEKETTVTATLLEPPTRNNGRVYYVVRVKETGLAGAPKNFKVRLSSAQPIEAELYDEVTCNVHFMKPPQSNDFDSLTYYRAKDIYLYAYVTDYNITAVTPEKKPLLYHITALRQTIKNRMLQIFPNDEGALMVGMLLGDRSEMDREIQDDFRGAGVSHMLALSGMHFAILSAMLFRFFHFLKLRRRTSALFLMGFSLFYLALVGFAPSIVRSCIMIMIFQASSLFKRRPDSLTSLGLAVLIMCAVSPFCAADIGFLLSVSATLGIIVLSPIAERKIKTATRGHLPKFVTESVAMSFSGSLFTLPVLILCFGEMATLSLLADVLLGLPGTWMLMLTFLFALLSFVPFIAFLSHPVGLAAGLLSKLMLVVTRWVADIPFAMLNASQDFVKLWMLSALLLFGMAYVLGRKKAPFRLAAMLSVILLLAGIFSFQISKHGATEVAVMDVGNGGSVIVTKGEHAAVISCGGDKMSGREALYYLKRQGTRSLDLLMLPALDSRSAGGAPDVLEKHSVQAVMMPSGGSLLTKVEHNIPELAVRRGFDRADIRIWGEVRIHTLEAGSGQIVYMTVKDISFLVLNGTMNASEVPGDWRAPDVLIFTQTPENLGLIDSQYTFCSMGREGSMLELSKIMHYNSDTYVTGGEGTIVMTCLNDREIRLRREG